MKLVRYSAMYLLLAFAGTTSAHMWSIDGVLSDFIVRSNRVYFLQTDNRLTALDGSDGSIVARSGPLCRYGRDCDLMETVVGLLVEAEGMVALYDYTTLQRLWETNDVLCVALSGRRIVYHTGRRTIECRFLPGGELVWTNACCRQRRLAANDENVLAHGWVIRTQTQCAAVIDAATGRTRGFIVEPSNAVFDCAYLGKDAVYVASASRDRRKGEGGFKELITFDLQGRELSRTRAPSGFFQADFRLERAFVLNGLLFKDGRVEPSALPDGILPRNKFISYDEALVHTNHLPECNVLLRRFGEEWSSQRTLLTIQNGTSAWTGILAYLEGVPKGVIPLTMGRPGTIRALASFDGRLVLGTDMGHVECIDVATGTSLWMYTFPSRLRMHSSSSPFHVPYAATFNRFIHSMEERRSNCPGILRLPASLAGDEQTLQSHVGSTKSPQPVRRVHIPDSFDWLPDISRPLRLAWCGAIVVGILGVVVVLYRGPGLRSAGIKALLLCCLSMAAFHTLYWHFRVSYASALALKAVLIVLTAASLAYLAAALRRRQWAFSSIVVVCMAVVAWKYWYMWYYSVLIWL